MAPPQQRVQQRPNIDFATHWPEPGNDCIGRNVDPIKHMLREGSTKPGVAGITPPHRHRAGRGLRGQKIGVWSRHGRWLYILPRPA